MGCGASVKLILPEHIVREMTFRMSPLTRGAARSRAVRPSDIKTLSSSTPFSGPSSSDPKDPNSPSNHSTSNYSKRLFLAFATQDFQHFPNLDHPIAECTSMAETFRQRDFDTTVLTNLTKSQVMRALFGLSVNRNDLLVVYFATHATSMNNGITYIAASDSAVSDDIRDKITKQELRCFSDICPANHVLFVFDCCFAGRFAKSRGVEGLPSFERHNRTERMRRNRALKARLIFTSGANETVPDESEFAKSMQTVLNNHQSPLSTMDAFVRIRKSVSTTALCSRWPDDGGDIFL